MSPEANLSDATLTASCIETYPKEDANRICDWIDVGGIKLGRRKEAKCFSKNSTVAAAFEKGCAKEAKLYIQQQINLGLEALWQRLSTLIIPPATASRVAETTC